MTIAEMVAHLQSLLDQGTDPDRLVALPGGEPVGGVEEHTHGVVVYQKNWPDIYGTHECPSCVKFRDLPKSKMR